MFATSGGFLETARHFLPRVDAFWRRLAAFDGYAFCLICSWVFDDYLSFLEPKYLLVKF